ncbi:MAG: phosphate-starvation-inducible PsiE family protein [Geitlerinemataceae cyanobacterium]
MRFWRFLQKVGSDEFFLIFLEKLEVIVAKFLSLLMVGLSLVAVYDLCLFLFQLLSQHIQQPLFDFPKEGLFEAFGLFLNVLIALEILENITVYLKDHHVQYELVVATSLIAIARKIIIFDIEKKDAMDLIALSIAVLTLSISYLIIRSMNHKKRG